MPYHHVPEVINLARKWIVMEPVFLMVTMTIMSSVTKQNIYVEKTIKDLTATSPASNPPSPDTVQSQAGHLISNLISLETGLSALVMIISGPLSDRYGRKYFILWNLTFLFASHVAFVLLCYASRGMDYSTGWYYAFSCVYGCGGGVYNYYLTTFSYVSDLSTLDPATRLTRFILAESCFLSALVAGSYLEGVISSLPIGDVGVFLFCGCLSGLSCVYVGWRLENIRPQETQQEKLVSLPRKILQLFTVTFERREGRRRQYIIIIVVCFLLQEIPYMMEDSLLVLYTRKLFNWNSQQLLDFKAVTYLVTNVGMALAFPLLKKVVGVPIMLIAALASISRAGYYLCIGFGRQELVFYLGAGVNLLASTMGTINRAKLSELIPPSQIGTMYAVLEVLVSCLPSLVCPVSSDLYSYTLSSSRLTGFWTLPALSCILLQFFLFISFHLVETAGEASNAKQ